MHDRSALFIGRVADAGQRFEPGMRVEFFPAEHDPRETVLEPAALGSYVVVGCDRVAADDRRWLEVRLRRLIHA